jgi:protease I
MRYSDRDRGSGAIIATDGFEESELTHPIRALKEAGAQVEAISPKSGQIQGFHHFDKAGTVRVDRKLEEADLEHYDALVLPGGALNADRIRIKPKLQQFIRCFQGAASPLRRSAMRLGN